MKSMFRNAALVSAIAGLGIAGAAYLGLAIRLASPELAGMIVDAPKLARRWLGRGTC